MSARIIPDITSRRDYGLQETITKIGLHLPVALIVARYPSICIQTVSCQTIPLFQSLQHYLISLHINHQCDCPPLSKYLHISCVLSNHPIIPDVTTLFNSAAHLVIIQSFNTLSTSLIFDILFAK